MVPIFLRKINRKHMTQPYLNDANIHDGENDKNMKERYPNGASIFEENKW